MIATFTEKGELQRMYFPSKDNRQYTNFFHTGVKINNSDLIYLHNDINNVYKQYYDTDTNVLNTEITNTYFNLKVIQTDYVLLKENVLVKRYIFLNNSKLILYFSILFFYFCKKENLKTFIFLFAPLHELCFNTFLKEVIL